MQAEPDSVNLRVPFHAPSAAVVRRRLRDWLAERGYHGERVDDARVVISELVGNSVRHAAPLPVNDLDVSWAVENEELVMSVSDGGSGSTSPHMVQAGQAAVSGRGLSIVAALAARWWVEDGGTTTTVHVRMPLR